MSSNSGPSGKDGEIVRRDRSNRPNQEEIRSMVRMCLQLVQYRLANYNKSSEVKPSVDRMFEPFQDLMNTPNRLCLANLKMKHFIAEGGYGRIWKCKYKDKPVVVKEPVEASMLPSQYTLERDLLLELKHKRIVKLLGFFFEAKAFFVLEFCLGALHKFTASEMGWPNIVRFIYQSFEAIAWIHHKGYIHRDIKPENFLVTTGNNLVLTDFGLAYKMEEGATYMVHDFEIGTCDMLDPPALREFKFGYSTDVFGAACGWFEVISGRPLLGPRYKKFYDAKNTKEMWKHHADAFEFGRIKEKLDGSKNYVPVKDDKNVFVREPIISRIVSNCPSIQELLMLALDANPDARPTASEVLQLDCMKEYLQMHDITLENMDSGDQWKMLTDRTKSSRAEANRHLWPKVVTDAEKYSLKPNTPKWWNFVTLSPLYYDGLDELLVPSKLSPERCSRSISRSHALVNAANNAVVSARKTGSGEEINSVQPLNPGNKTITPLGTSGQVAAIISESKNINKGNRATSDDDTNSNFELPKSKRLKRDENAQISIKSNDGDIEVLAEITSPFFKNADSDVVKNVVYRGSDCIQKASAKSPVPAKNISQTQMWKGLGVYEPSPDKSVQTRISQQNHEALGSQRFSKAPKTSFIPATPSNEGKSQGSIKATVPFFQSKSNPSNTATTSKDVNSQGSKKAGVAETNNKPTGSTRCDFYKICKIKNCVGVFDNEERYKQHIVRDHPGILLCEYCSKFLCNKQVKLQKHKTGCKKNPRNA